MLSHWQGTWERWRTPLKAIGGVALLIVLGTMYAIRPTQWWTIGTRGVERVEDLEGASFFADSTMVVYLAAHEGATMPIRLTVFYQGSGVPISPVALRRALERTITGRTGARLEVRGGGHMDRVTVPAPSLTLAIDVWAGGGMRTDIQLRCRHPHPEGEATLFLLLGVEALNSEWSGFGTEELFQGVIARRITDAATYGCPTRPQSATPTPTRGAP